MTVSSAAEHPPLLQDGQYRSSRRGPTYSQSVTCSSITEEQEDLDQQPDTGALALMDSVSFQIADNTILAITDTTVSASVDIPSIVLITPQQHTYKIYTPQPPPTSTTTPPTTTRAYHVRSVSTDSMPTLHQHPRLPASTVSSVEKESISTTPLRKPPRRPLRRRDNEDNLSSLAKACPSPLPIIVPKTIESIPTPPSTPPPPTTTTACEPEISTTTTTITTSMETVQKIFDLSEEISIYPPPRRSSLNRNSMPKRTQSLPVSSLSPEVSSTPTASTAVTATSSPIIAPPSSIFAPVRRLHIPYMRVSPKESSPPALPSPTVVVVTESVTPAAESPVIDTAVVNVVVASIPDEPSPVTPISTPTIEYYHSHHEQQQPVMTFTFTPPPPPQTPPPVECTVVQQVVAEPEREQQVEPAESSEQEDTFQYQRIEIPPKSQSQPQYQVIPHPAFLRPIRPRRRRPPPPKPITTTLTNSSSIAKYLVKRIPTSPLQYDITFFVLNGFDNFSWLPVVTEECEEVEVSQCGGDIATEIDLTNTVPPARTSSLPGPVSTDTETTPVSISSPADVSTTTQEQQQQQTPATPKIGGGLPMQRSNFSSKMAIARNRVRARNSVAAGNKPASSSSSSSGNAADVTALLRGRKTSVPVYEGEGEKGNGNKGKDKGSNEEESNVWEVLAKMKKDVVEGRGNGAVEV
ncbi:hypothetical protein HDU76_003940 [Blyttiomyces sp. JEL0837]|nr:hypothetical protein HDU76_003940 [Blyttiomyces sp. JEL0837]